MFCDLDELFGYMTCTYVCRAAFVALMRFLSVTFSRINKALVSCPCRRNAHSGSELLKKPQHVFRQCEPVLNRSVLKWRVSLTLLQAKWRAVFLFASWSVRSAFALLTSTSIHLREISALTFISISKSVTLHKHVIQNNISSVGLGLVV